MATRRALSSVLRSASRLRAASPSPCPRAPLHHRPSPAGFLLNRAAAYASSTMDGTEGLVRDQRVLNTGSPITGGIKRTRTTISKKSGEAMMFPLQFHYEDVLRQDLLLKLNHANIMEVPGLFEIRLVPKAASDFRTQIGKLAMEIFCGQRFIQTQRDPYLKARKSFRSNPFLGSGKDTGNVSDFAGQSVLRGHGMYHFLVRILTVMSMLDSPVKMQENSIKFCMETEFCEFSPELEDHFEIFEHIRGFNVTIVTSANTKDETSLLWSGFLLKDEGEN